MARWTNLAHQTVQFWPLKNDLWPERSKVLAITLKSSITHIAIHLNNSPTCTLFFAFSLRVKLLLCSVFSLCCLSLVKLGSFFIQKTCWTLTGRSFPGFPSVVNLCGWFWGNPGDTGLLLELGSTQTWRRLTDGKTQWPPPPPSLPLIMMLVCGTYCGWTANSCETRQAEEACAHR